MFLIHSNTFYINRESVGLIKPYKSALCCEFWDVIKAEGHSQRSQVGAGAQASHSLGSTITVGFRVGTRSALLSQQKSKWRDSIGPS